MPFSPLISVIVAVYNGGLFIRKGISSILEQSLCNIELIIVNDGSTDETEIICNEYSRKDPRVHVFHEKHQGVAHARQVGINNACGIYTIHIDADDHISRNMLEEMYNSANNSGADILICDYMEVNNHGSIYHAQQPTILTQEGVTNDLIRGKLYGALWNKLIRTSCFRDNNVCFREDLTMREDMFFVLDVLPYCSKIAYLPEALYSYDKTSNASSLTNTYLSEDRKYYVQELKWHETALKNTLVSKENKEHVSNSLLNIAYITLNGSIFTKAEWKKSFSKYNDVFDKAANNYKKRLVLMAINKHYHLASTIRAFLSILKRKA